MILDFFLGGFITAVCIIGYWMLMALLEWNDMRQVRRLQRTLAKQSKPHPHGS